MKIFDAIHNKIAELVKDDEQRKIHQLMYIEIVLGIISAVMSIINIFTRQKILLIATASTSVISFANYFIIKYGKCNKNVGIIVFFIKVVALFTYFIITGGTQGFSTIWLLLLPTLGMFVFGRKNGSFVVVFFFVELVVFFYTPLRGVLDLEGRVYTSAFLTRFPVVYLCFYLLGFFLEYIREVTYRRMNALQQEADYRAMHDSLTGLYNRVGFNNKMAECLENVKKGKHFALFLSDIDKFKELNDTYGHEVGDIVLKVMASRINSSISDIGIACRWGGEEFAVIIDDIENINIFDLAEKIRLSVYQPITVEKTELLCSVSIGGVVSSELQELNRKNMVSVADKKLYKAKETGRNKSVVD